MTPTVPQEQGRKSAPLEVVMASARLYPVTFNDDDIQRNGVDCVGSGTRELAGTKPCCLN